MSSVCYILYSPSLDRYYIGASRDAVSVRLARHNSGYYGSKSFTSKASDWELYFELHADDYAHAVRMEDFIKSMKSRKYIENLTHNIH